MKNTPAEEINRLLAKLRVCLADVIETNQKFNNDFYLYRWLLNNNMKLDRTEQYIRESIEWRKGNNVEELADQEWGELQNDISIKVGGFTKIGQPVTTSNGENVNFRAIVQKYGKEALRRYLIQFFVKLEKLMLDHYKDGPSDEYNNSNNSNKICGNSQTKTRGEGYNSSWFSAAPIHIVSYKNFSLWNATYVEGIQVLLEGIKVGLTYFPSCLSEAYVVNLNIFSNVLIKMIKPLITTESLVLEFFDTDQEKWLKVLLKNIDANKLDSYFGGTLQLET